MTELPQTLYGYKIIASPNLTANGPDKEVLRTWKERLFETPWNPWKKFKTIRTYLPSQDMIVDKLNGKIYIHPEVFGRLKEHLEHFPIRNT